MTYDARYLPAFREALSALERAAGNLSFTLDRLTLVPPPTTAGVTALSPEDRERFDALTARFARCQQMAGSAFKALALLEAAPGVITYAGRLGAYANRLGMPLSVKYR